MSWLKRTSGVIRFHGVCAQASNGCSARDVRARFALGRRVRSLQCVPNFAHPSWPSNRPVEYWCFNDKAAVSKLVALKDLEAEIANGILEQDHKNKVGSPSSTQDTASDGIARWLVFPGRDEETAKVLSRAFNVHESDLRISKPLSRAKVEFIAGKSTEGDHLCVGVHDFRLQEDDTDGVEGFVDDISWVQEVYSDNQRASLDDVQSSLSKCLVAHEVSFMFFPATNTLVTVGAESAYMLQAGRAAIQNQRSQVRTSNHRGEHGASALLLLLLDAFMDSVFPVLTLFGSAVDSIAKGNVTDPHPRHVVLSKQIKRQLHKILRQAWQFRLVYIELQQDFHGCMGNRRLLEALIRSTKLIEIEAEAHARYCQSIQDFHMNRLQERLNRTLYMLTGVSVVAIPAQFLTGVFGMNFEYFPLVHSEYGQMVFWVSVGVSTLACRAWFTAVMKRDISLTPLPAPAPRPKDDPSLAARPDLMS